MIQSKTYKGVRDWSVKAKRDNNKVMVTVRCGGLFTKAMLSVNDWPSNLFDQRQQAAKALGESIGVPEIDWESGELDRIPDEIVKAMNDVKMQFGSRRV